MRQTLALLVTVISLAACGPDAGGPAAPESGATATPPTNGAAKTAEPTTSTTLFGVAGLIPANWPHASDDDWRALFESFGEAGPLVGAYQAWDQHEPIALAFALAAEHDITPVVALGVTRDLDGGTGVEPHFDLADIGARRAFVENAVALVEEHGIEYLLVSTEVDRLHASDPDAFDDFVTLYRETYTAVKAASPDTVVFTAFQLEMLRGEAALSGRAWEARWHLIQRFEGYLDLVGFTTFPFLDYEDPADIPDDYYESITEQTDVPIAFTEIGWPSAPLSGAPASLHGGDPAQQAAFVERFGQLAEAIDVRLALWAFPHDPGTGVLFIFESIGLRANDGSPKPALKAWQDLAGVR